jgi:NhaP-type Na+/H+ or K+/H+ antiporter
VTDEVPLLIAGILAGGFAAHWLAWRLRVPAIVFLLAGGLIAGPVTGAIDPDETFGGLLFPIVSVAVAVILFEGALGLGIEGVKLAGRAVWLLLTVGAGITLVLTTVIARVVLDVEPEVALLLAAILVVTGPTVIGPIVRTVGLRGRLGALLEAEGTLIDPIGAILTLLVFQFAFERRDGGNLLLETAETFVLGIALGLIGAIALTVALSRFLVPDQLHQLFTLAVVVGAFAVSNAVREESGLVAVTAMGIALTVQRRVTVRHVLEFNETLRILFISALFILLAARIERETLTDLEWRNIVLLAALVLVVRPLAVFVSTWPTSLRHRERWFLAATAPRGIVAAAVASVVSLRLAELGEPGSQVIISATFTVIAGTVLLSGLGARPLARRLALVDPTASGTLVILGANDFTNELATTLERHGVAVRVVDLDRRRLASARMAGIGVHRGSVFADETWEQVGFDRASAFLAATGNDELNALAGRHLAAGLGRRAVFQLVPSRQEHAAWWRLPPGTFARTVFAADATLPRLLDRLERGWRIAATRLTEQFPHEAWRGQHPEAIPLVVIDRRGQAELAALDRDRVPRAGETVVALVPPRSPS